MKKILLYLPSLIAVMLAVFPFFAHAQSEINQGMMSIKSPFPSFGIAGSTTLTGSAGLITNIIRMLLLIAGAIAVLFVIFGGFQYLTSAGNAEQAEKGKTTLVNAIIGIVIIILSYVIINVVVNLVAFNRA